MSDMVCIKPIVYKLLIAGHNLMAVVADKAFTAVGVGAGLNTVPPKPLSNRSGSNVVNLCDAFICKVFINVQSVDSVSVGPCPTYLLSDRTLAGSGRNAKLLSPTPYIALTGTPPLCYLILGKVF